MGNKVAQIKMITDQGNVLVLEIYTQDYGLDFRIHQNQRRIFEGRTILGEGIKKLDSINGYEPFINIDFAPVISKE